MSRTDIEYFMHSLSELHHKFSQKNYELSSIDVHAARNILEQLYVQLLIAPTSTPHIESSVIPQPQIIVDEGYHETNVTQANQIIDDDFKPKKKTNLSENEEPSQTKASSTQFSFLADTSEPFQLGINERIMFAKELFDDDASMLDESVRRLSSFENKEMAFAFFDNQLSPFLVDEGKEEEIIAEFRSIIARIYK